MALIALLLYNIYANFKILLYWKITREIHTINSEET